MDPALNFGSPAGIVQAIKGSEMVARAVRQSEAIWGCRSGCLACMSLHLDELRWKPGQRADEKRHAAGGEHEHARKF